ncbi:uncharacterized protein LOC119737381 [Patiria miniata]|uniref:Zinc finger CCCH domain-containing protein 3 n=1 Tax=Patiria miniata TaxID=46514 RepID=A0A914AVB5_PATMI|nr:uncharacterized protein LOC119737381 [Patiria miniata]
MANYDRQSTLSRLSKLQQEIQKLTDSLNSPKPLSTSSKYSIKAASEPTPRYTSELEAKYLGKGYDRTKHISTTSRDSKVLTKTSGANPCWSYDRWSADPGKSSALVSRSSTYSTKASSEHRSSTPNQSGYTSRESGQYSAAKSPSLDAFTQRKSYRQSSFLSVPVESFPIQRSTSQGYLSSSSRLKEIEDKYLLGLPVSSRSSSTWQMSQKPGLHSSLSETPRSSTTRSLSASDPLSKSWSRRSLKEHSHRSTHLVKPTSPISSHSPKGSSSKYSWRPSHHASQSDDGSRSLFRSNTTPTSRSRSSETERRSSTSRHHSLDSHRSKYRFESSKTPSSSSRKHGHDSHHHKPSTSHSSRYTYTSTPSASKSSHTHHTSHATTNAKPIATPSSSLHKSTRHHDHVSARSYGFPSRTGPAYIRSRGRGFASSRGRGSPFSRGFSFSAFRGRGAVTFRGRGAVTFRGRGGRGYRSSIFRGYGSGRSRGRGLYRGQGSFGQRSARGSRLPHRSSDDRKGSSSSCKMATKGSYSSRYALKKSHASSVQRKPLTFMERRRQTVLSNTPVLLRSRYNLVKGHRSVVRPLSSMTSLSRSSRKTSDVERLVTVKNTKTKLIRRAEGDRRPSGSLVNVGGSPFKLRINRYSKVLHRIQPSTHTAPSGHPTSSPSTSRKRTETPSHSSRHSHKPAFKSSSTPSVTRKVASHVLRRSIHVSLAAKERSKKQSQMKQYCMFYNLYGRCKRGNACPYIHDPDKVAVCTRFLRGTCPKTDGSCLFSHKVSKDKMPVCSYFLRGVCNRDDCPYSHVKVSSKATPCAAFIKGHCPLGDKCKKQHILRCAQFSKTGKCDKGKACPLLHKKDAGESSRSKTKTKKAAKRSGHTYETDTRTQPKKAKRADENINTPSFIKLSADGPPEKIAPSESATGEAADNMPSFISVTAEEGEAKERAPSVTTSGEVRGIIPSFIKLSSLDKTKEIASSTEHKTTTKAEAKSTNPSLIQTSNDPSSDVAASYNQTDCLELFDDTPISNNSSQDDPITAPPSDDTHTLAPAKLTSKAKKEVTLPSLTPNEKGSTASSMPSYIELSVGNTPADQMEDLAHTAQQELRRSSRIKPRFSK